MKEPTGMLPLQKTLITIYAFIKVDGMLTTIKSSLIYLQVSR